MGVSSDGYPLYLRDLVEITRGYEDPANVMNFRTVKVPHGIPRQGRLSRITRRPKNGAGGLRPADWPRDHDFRAAGQGHEHRRL